MDVTEEYSAHALPMGTQQFVERVAVANQHRAVDPVAAHGDGWVMKKDSNRFRRGREQIAQAGELIVSNLALRIVLEGASSIEDRDAFTAKSEVVGPAILIGG